jgi:hypothetical protein
LDGSTGYQAFRKAASQLMIGAKIKAQIRAEKSYVISGLEALLAAG